MTSDKLSRRAVLKGALASTIAVTTVTDAAPIQATNKHWAMVIDLRKCVGCQACTVSCKLENNAPTGQFRTWVADIEVGQYPDTKRFFLPKLCNHCDNPSCIPVCPTGATHKQKDGIVVVDSERCWGCGACVTACPYNARFINQETKIADKCTFCAHRLEQGLKPACQETCVGGARVLGDLNDPQSDIRKILNQHPVSTLKAQTNNQPNVFYIGLNNADAQALTLSKNAWLVDLEKNLNTPELIFKGQAND